MIGDGIEAAADAGPDTRPAGFCSGPGHVVVYGNPAFRRSFPEALGLPAREGLIELPAIAFALLDAVYLRGRPLARWVRIGGEEWRLTVAPRRDPETQEVYGVAFHLRARSDAPGVDAVESVEAAKR